MDNGICYECNKDNYSVGPGAVDEPVVSCTEGTNTTAAKAICIDGWYTEIKTGDANINLCVVCPIGSNFSRLI